MGGRGGRLHDSSEQNPRTEGEPTGSCQLLLTMANQILAQCVEGTISSFFRCPFDYAVVVKTAVSVIKTLSLTQRY